MKFFTSFLIPLFAGAALAASEPSNVFILSGSELRQDSQHSAPALTPEQARLILAQRLHVTPYHSLNDAEKQTIEYISEFGGPTPQLFTSKDDASVPLQLVVVLEGVTPAILDSFTSKWSNIMPAFTIHKQPSSAATNQLLRDLKTQMTQRFPPSKKTRTCLLADDLDPFNQECWGGNAKIISLDAKSNENGVQELIEAQDELLKFVKKEFLDVMFMMIPESSRNSKNSVKAYGSYEMPRKLAGRGLEEKPFSGAADADTGAQQARPFQSAPTGIIPLCHTSEDACNVATNNCSGHGQCYLKSGTTGDEGRACFSCGCRPSVDETEAGKKTIYWAGPACSKQDISSPFWLLAGFSVALIGIVGAAIGMMFSVGQEKLPGVIGAGVSNPKAR